jgi:exosome complex exonuclease RRP6
VRPNVSQGRLDPALQYASHLQKPQLKFKKKPDNDRNSVWQPSLKHKYNAQVPLGYNFQDGSENIPSYNMYVESALLSLPHLTADRPHPYRYEIIKTIYPERMFESHPPIHPKSFDETPLHWISTPSEFQNMLQKLREANEIAVDLEHHNYRSFSGFVCLMQISTRAEDFIVDTLLLREELEELNEVFTNPNIIKV